MHATRPLFTTRPHAMFYGAGAASLCMPTAWSDQDAVTFAENAPEASGAKLRVTSVVRVPCDCRPGFVHIQLGGK